MTIVNEDDKHLVFVPLVKLTTPPSGIIKHLKDRYWVVHPTKGAVLWAERGRMFPQCNGNRLIAEKFVETMYPWGEARFIPSAFQKIRIEDYAQ